MGNLNGAVVFVSGGARGMGASHARAFVAEGAKVVIGDVLEEEGRALAAEVGEAMAFTRLDVTSEESWKNAVAFAEATFGPLQVLINNAGVELSKNIENTGLAEWQRVLNINLNGVFLGIREAIPSMRKSQGDRVIINVSSTAGIMGYAGLSAYTASKFAVRGLTKVAAMELGPEGIRVVSVHPGPIRTPMTAGMGDELTAGQPIARMGEPAEVSALMVFLAGKATFMTGSEWVVDGGALLGPVMPTLPLKD